MLALLASKLICGAFFYYHVLRVFHFTSHTKLALMHESRKEEDDKYFYVLSVPSCCSRGRHTKTMKIYGIFSFTFLSQWLVFLSRCLSDDSCESLLERKIYVLATYSTGILFPALFYYFTQHDNDSQQGISN